MASRILLQLLRASFGMLISITTILDMIWKATLMVLYENLKFIIMSQLIFRPN